MLAISAGVGTTVAPGEMMLLAAMQGNGTPGAADPYAIM